MTSSYRRGTRRKRTDWGALFECALIAVVGTLILLVLVF